MQHCMPYEIVRSRLAASRAGLERFAKLLGWCDAEAMKAYSEDLRQRIVQAVASGCSQPVAADRYNVSLTSVSRYVTQWRTTGSLAAQPRSGRPRAIPPAVDAALVAQFAADPDATFATYCDRWEAATGVRVSESTMYRAQRRAGWTRKKRV